MPDPGIGGIGDAGEIESLIGVEHEFKKSRETIDITRITRNLQLIEQTMKLLGWCEIGFDGGCP